MQGLIGCVDRFSVDVLLVAPFHYAIDGAVLVGIEESRVLARQAESHDDISLPHREAMKY